MPPRVRSYSVAINVPYQAIPQLAFTVKIRPSKHSIFPSTTLFRSTRAPPAGGYERTGWARVVSSVYARRPYAFMAIATHGQESHIPSHSPTCVGRRGTALITWKNEDRRMQTSSGANAVGIHSRHCS